MDSMIKLDDIKVNTWEIGVVKAEITDTDGNPLNGKAVVKVNQITRIQGNVVNGVFCEEHDFSDLQEDEYDLYMIYGGTSLCNPSDASAKLYLNRDKPLDVSFFDLQNACYRLVKWINVNKKIPGKIAINQQPVGIGNLLKALALSVKQMNDENSGDVTIVKAKTPRVSSENITEEIQVPKEDYVKYANEIIDYVNVNGECPAFISVNDEKIGFMNLIYTFATIITNSSESGLISSVYIRPWKSNIS